MIKIIYLDGLIEPNPFKACVGMCGMCVWGGGCWVIAKNIMD